MLCQNIPLWITGSTLHFRPKPVKQMLWGNAPYLTVPLSQILTFPKVVVSILELKVYGLLLDLREDFINSFLDLLDGITSSCVSKFEPVINNNSRPPVSALSIVNYLCPVILYRLKDKRTS
jgi:hypothetical protein